jgi:hypothetical protein
LNGDILDTVKTNKRQPQLPIGRTARFAFDLDAIRADCSEAANQICQKKKLDEVELEECARLDDALAEAQRVLKTVVRNIMLSRINRRSRRTRAR